MESGLDTRRCWRITSIGGTPGTKVAWLCIAEIFRWNRCYSQMTKFVRITLFSAVIFLGFLCSVDPLLRGEGNERRTLFFYVSSIEEKPPDKCGMD